MVEPHAFGRACEALAAESLVAAGWRIIERNYRFGRREVDLIASRHAVIAFIEVKGRRGDGYGHPLEAITWRKRHEIRLVAEHWIARHGRAGQIYRFDAIAVTAGAGTRPVVEHVEDAWRL
jgi:putative endonuclease